MSEFIPSTEAVEIAAKLMWKERALGTTTPDYPWRGLAEEGRERLREHAREVLTAALAAHDAEIAAKALEEVAETIATALPGSEAVGYYASESDSGYREAERDIEGHLRARAAEYRKAVQS